MITIPTNSNSLNMFSIKWYGRRRMYGMVETKDEGRNGEKKGIINKI